jgi:hypothetical protein
MRTGCVVLVSTQASPTVPIEAAESGLHPVRIAIQNPNQVAKNSEK